MKNWGECLDERLLSDKLVAVYEFKCDYLIILVTTYISFQQLFSLLKNHSYVILLIILLINMIERYVT